MDINAVMGALDEEKVMALAGECRGLDELASRLGISGDGAVDAILAVAPRVEWVFRARMGSKALAGEVDPVKAKGIRRNLIRALWMRNEPIERDLEGIDMDEVALEAGVERDPLADRMSSSSTEPGVDVDDGPGFHRMGDDDELMHDDEEGLDNGDGLREYGPKGRRAMDRKPVVRAVKVGGGMVVARPVQALRPLAKGELACAVIAGDVRGWTGATYMGRGVVSVDRRPEAFGCPRLKREAVVQLTLHKGILNHMGMRVGVPTPYWAVLDAMSDLGEFTMQEVMSRAMGVCGDGSIDACRTAWYVLKSHQTHPKERYRGMAFIVEAVPGKAERFSIRGRRASEGQAVVDAGREERMAARRAKAGTSAGRRRNPRSVEQAVLATHVVQEVN